MLTKESGIPFAQINDLSHLDELLSTRELHKENEPLSINKIFDISLKKINSLSDTLILIFKESSDIGLTDMIYNDLLQHCIISCLYNIEALHLEQSYGTPQCHIINTLYKRKIGDTDRFSLIEKTDYNKRFEFTYYDKLYNILRTDIPVQSKKFNTSLCNKKCGRYSYIHKAIGLYKRKHKSKGYSYYCHPASLSFIDDIYKLLLKKRINLTYNIHKANTTSNDNNENKKFPSYSAGNRNRYVNDYISWLDYINNTLIDYSALEDDITKILYYYRAERTFSFRLLEWIFNNRIAFELDKSNEYISTKYFGIKKSETNIEKNQKQLVFNNDFWIELSYCPNCFSILKWIPFLINLTTEITPWLQNEIFELEKDFTLSIINYCNRNLGDAIKLLRDYIEENKSSTEWHDLLSQIKEKEKDYLNTKTSTLLYANGHKHISVTSTGEKLHLTNAYKNELNIKIEKDPLLQKEINFSKIYSSEIDEYLSKRYDPSWWHFD